MSFTHLHVHSHYSLLDGLPKIDELIYAAKKNQMDALALTDHGAMYGCVEFYTTALQKGVKPIIGMEAYMSPYAIESERGKTERKRYHLTLLARNNEGYKNLMRLTSIGWLSGFFYKPRIDLHYLQKYADGLIILTGCLSGEIPQALLEGNMHKAQEILKRYQSIVGEENVFIEIQAHPEMKEYTTVSPLLVKLSKQQGTPLVATNDVHYISIEDKVAQDALVCIQTNRKIEDKNRLSMTASHFHFTSEREMKEMFVSHPEAVDNTSHVAQLCNIDIPLGKWLFPSVAIPEGKTADQHLADLGYEGIRKRLGNRALSEEYKKRIGYELDIIKTKGYAPYFLVVADIVSFAKKQGIITTTRGSAAGSLVSYAIGITTADPMDFDLPFERFLNPFRPSPPDIDLDIEDARRGELIHYCQEKYGSDKVAHIITFGTLLARAAVRDIGRVLNLPYSFCDKVAKMIPLGKQGFKMTLKRALEESPELKSAYDDNDDVKRMIDLAQKIEGCVRHASVHAAGVVIAPDEITQFTPIQKDPEKGEISTQYDMHAVEEAGLLKMDFLGITNLSILGLAREIIKRTQKRDIDLNNLPLDDKKTYELLSSGETMGVFQLSGSGMTRYLKELSPSNIFDIMAMISLYRPGPMESIPAYILRKQNPSLVRYPHPKLKKILKKSYGIITYQDDVLLTAIELAGYNWEEADKLRKAIGKKIPEEMAKQHNTFIQGAMAHSGLTELEAEKIWRLIEPFAAYGFNKAHGSSYALIAFQTAYVKAHYPVEFMAAFLTCESGNMEKVAEGIVECERLGVRVLPPDVNESLGGFTVVKDVLGKQNIRFGLNAIKHLGKNIIDLIIAQRKDNGEFKSIVDFLTRISVNNKKSLEALIRSGALDRFGKRVEFDASISNMLRFQKTIRNDNDSQQSSLFGKHFNKRALTLDHVPSQYEFSELSYEKEYLGLYLTAHPLQEVAPILENLGVSKIKVLRENPQDAQKVIIIGIISEIKGNKTRSNERMLFVKVEDMTGSIEVLVFPRLYQKHAIQFKEEELVIIQGSSSTKEDSLKIIANTIQFTTKDTLAARATQALNRKLKEQKVEKKTNESSHFFVAVPPKISKHQLKALKNVIYSHPGDTPVYLRVDGERVKILKTNMKVSLTDELKISIEEIFQVSHEKTWKLNQ